MNGCFIINKPINISMKILNLLENEILLESTIKLTDLYDSDELEDESEALYHYVYPEDYDFDFTIRTMTPDEAKAYTTPNDNTTVYQAYKDHATKEQRRLVAAKAKHYDENRIIVVSDKTVVDGNHQLIAGIIAKKPIKYIDLSEVPPTQ